MGGCASGLSRAGSPHSRASFSAAVPGFARRPGRSLDPGGDAVQKSAFRDGRGWPRRAEGRAAGRRQARGVGMLTEVAGQAVGCQRVTMEARQHVPAVVVAITGLCALQPLEGDVCPQDRDGGAVQGDDPLAVGCLRRAHRDVPVVLLQLSGDDCRGRVQVDVAPAQPAGIAAAEPAQRDQVVPGVQAVAADGIEERGGLRRGPHRH